MKTVLKVFLISLAALVLFIVGSVAFNLADESVNPEITKTLNQPRDFSPKVVEGFKYMLGLWAPKTKKPGIVGAAIYDSATDVLTTQHIVTSEMVLRIEDPVEVPDMFTLCGKPPLCDKMLWNAHAKEIAETLKANDFLLRRFDELMTFGAYASDLKPNFAPSIRVSPFLKLARLKEFQWSHLVRTGKFSKVISDLVAANAFYSQSLNYPHSLLETMILALLFKENREFLKKAVEENPKLKEALSPQQLATFKLERSYEQVAQLSFRNELEIFNVIVNEPSLYLDALSDHPQKSAFRLSVAKFFLSKNRTLNSYYKLGNEALSNSCVKSETRCDDSPFEIRNYLVNPVGKLIIRMVGARPSVFWKLFRNIKELQAPLTFS